MHEKVLRGVVDTNVLVSAALLGGIPRRAIEKLLDNGISLTSLQTARELTDVLGRPKFNRYVSEQARMRFVLDFLKIMETVAIQEVISICRDPKDNKFLEVAVNGDADVLITGDPDLLVLHPFRTTAIVTPRDFLEHDY